ncbi:MarC family protein [Halarcobacter bivalviorum]|uniref:MarC family protein n=1 Tax=Halarcobacter bivalviorum TaxID=663364 RepID=UPI00100AB99F|nr:MarC family protein [Halarcobacter bivalviorum]RXK05648.1 antibiotic resistance protein MarC [Halarcobacter bivalviorum]
MELLSNFLQQTITIFAIMDPIGISALALSLLSPNITKTQISTIARKSTFTIIIAFFVVLITGDTILKIFGIGENSLKVMGGIILLMMAISMVNGSAKEGKKDDNKSDEELSVIPIGIPIAFGAGLFTTIIIFKHEAETFVDLISITIAFCVNAFLFYLILKNSIYIRKLFGATGQNVVTKLMGLIVGAIAVQFIISGIVSLTKFYLQ